ncbi:WXG100 family type VII secretion target [Paenibacillus faecalis]|uniref:WXG100 family type VII secretion target n=1 Tax=Paenibacillus faecalis TaxID=2079532 RepID=UPI000D0F0AFE|nr:WXG100 family type VII secretion target [Paenibacillus faecalis]
MSRIRANIAALERAAAQFARAGQELGQIAGEQQSRIASIDWAGRAEQKFMLSWNESRESVKRLTALTAQMAAQCQSLAEALRRADEEQRK